MSLKPGMTDEQVVAYIKNLEQENQELKQFLTVVKKSTELKMRCVEIASTKQQESRDIISVAQKLFEYVSSTKEIEKP